METEKTFKGRRPHTSLRLTAQGRAAFNAYARKMKQVFQDFSTQ